jgi:DNA-binding transcriptional MerR regulator
MSIGQFAALGGVTVKALRLYADRGLLRPAVTVPETGYRRYSRGQVATLHRLLLLKHAGVPLAAIREHLAHPDHRLLSRLRNTLRQRLDETRRQISWVDAELRAAGASSESAPPAVLLKRVNKLIVTSRRQRIDSYEQADGLLESLRRDLRPSARLVPGAIWHDCGRKTRTIDCEAFWVLSRPVATGSMTELAPVRVASIMHRGDDSTIAAAYETLRHWIKDNRLTLGGPTREIYFETADPARGAAATLTEVQFPIAESV